jgi:DNA-binding HxlR family transcriptional regulator
MQAISNHPSFMPRTTKSSEIPAAARRSLCPIACSLEIFGDRWSLLVIRDLVLGSSRFKDFTASPEGIPTNILSERLERLQLHGILIRVAVGENSKRFTYELTEKGDALRPVLRSMVEWGLKWEEGTRTDLKTR